jgi:hypothetical protein
MIKSPNLRNTSPGMPDPTCEICPEEVSRDSGKGYPKYPSWLICMRKTLQSSECLTVENEDGAVNDGASK